MRRSVFKIIKTMIKYSNGVETAIFHILYLQLFLSLGMYLSNGLAWMTKSMQDFCREENVFSCYMKNIFPSENNLFEDL